MSAQPLIIDARHNQTWIQRWTSWVLTLVCWTLWCWLWWPYATDVLPMSLPAPPAPSGPRLDYLFEQAGLILLAGALLVLWALVHTWRFAHVTRRRVSISTSLDQLAQAIGLAPALLDQARASQCVIAHHHPHGGLQKLELLDMPWAVPFEGTRWSPAPPPAPLQAIDTHG